MELYEIKSFDEKSIINIEKLSIYLGTIHQIQRKVQLYLFEKTSKIRSNLVFEKPSDGAKSKTFFWKR